MRMLRLSIAFVLAAAGWVLSNEASAQTGPEVIKAKGCHNCHDVEKMKVGPAFKEIATKKAGKADELVAKLKHGKGHMKINATEAEIKAAVDQVLATK